MKKLAMLLVPLALVACGPDYDRTEISGVVTGKLGGSVNVSRVSVPEGSIVKAHLVSYDTDDKTMTAEIRSADERVLQVAPVVTKDDWAFLGVAPGRTTVDIKADGHTVLVIDAIVTPQPAPP